MSGGILLVVPSLETGGAERQVSVLAPGLMRRGYPVEVATFAPGGLFHEPLREAGIAVHVLARDGRVGLPALLGLMSLLRRSRPRVLQSFLWSANFGARLAAWMRRDCRVVIGIRGFDDELSRSQRRAGRLVDRRTDVVVSNCEALRREAQRQGIGRRARHLVIYNGLESGPELSDPAAPALPIIGWVGRLERKKDPLAMVPVMARLAPRLPDCRVVVVGGGSLEPDLRRAVADVGLERSFEFAGSRADVGALLPTFRVVVNTSLSEGCSNVLLEAMRAARPIVATAVGGNVEIVEDGATGRLVAQGDAVAMADALAGLLEDRELSERMGARGAERVRRQFSMTALIDAHARLYQELGVQPGPAPPAAMAQP